VDDPEGTDRAADPEVTDRGAGAGPAPGHPHLGVVEDEAQVDEAEAVDEPEAADV